MTQQASGTGQSVYYAGLAGVVIIIIGALWLLFSGGDDNTETVALPPVILPTPDVTPDPAPTLSEPEPAIIPTESPVVAQVQLEPAEPVIPEPVLPPLPALDDSDAMLAADFFALNWKPGLAGLFNREEMIRHFVVTIDNLAQGQLVAGHNVLTAPASGYQVENIAQDRYKVSPNNATRYEPYIQLLESVPVRQLLALKQRYQPLLDEAFAELGYPDLTFDQRLRQAIAVLLATPRLDADVELTRPTVFYTYADEQLEALPEAQKQVLRLSPAQQQRLKALLTAYQQALGN
ncbi:DUF3014 domain-containing protein [Alishewanella tabrizica]|uniref:DUF3014 domain-containing protein n=1 Tax=Alishewanella tabrizica TaxID=671278 RepID=A0ABQ2WDJ8_9ALTE|nr:DUF3014 domain-containing protein [Alishewanella tabrizica]GGW51238.1 hypothetical protein GCM10008111_03990 [Alishewanella tabrizica]